MVLSPTIRQLRYFIAAANAGQVSKAAKEINVSQSAITSAIKGLEDLIGSPLFERHHTGIELTYEGNLFLDNARHIIHSVEEAVRIPRQVKEDINGTIKLAVTYTVAGYFIPKILSRFARTFQNVNIDMVEADRNTIEEGIVSKNFDLAVMLTSNIINHEDLSHSLLFKSRRRLWVNSTHKLLRKKSISLQNVSEEPYIMLTVDEASNTAQRYWNKTEYRPQVTFRTTSVEAVRSMVANGMGVSILSDMVYRPWSLEGRRVEVLDLVDNIPTMDVGLAWLSGVEKSEAVKAFIEFVHLSMNSE